MKAISMHDWLQKGLEGINPESIRHKSSLSRRKNVLKAFSMSVFRTLYYLGKSSKLYMSITIIIYN